MKNCAETSLEPKIDDMLADPIMLAVLKRDGLTVSDVRQVIASYHQKRSHQPN